VLPAGAAGAKAKIAQAASPLKRYARRLTIGHISSLYLLRIP
jgi:hypothetical protein